MHPGDAKSLETPEQTFKNLPKFQIYNFDKTKLMLNNMPCKNSIPNIKDLTKELKSWNNPNHHFDDAVTLTLKSLSTQGIATTNVCV